MVVSLVLIFIISLTLSFFEERFSQRDRIVMYVILGIALILTAGLRGFESTPDTEGYVAMFEGTADAIQELVEPSFTFIITMMNAMDFDATSLFLTYAIISVPIHLSILWRLSKDYPFTILTIYISYYFMMHEMVQIRAGVAAGLFLWAIYYYVEKRKLLALSFILVGIFFHYSALIGLVLFVLKDKLPKWQKIVLYLIIPIGLVIYFSKIDISYLIPDSLTGGKLAVYRELNDKGIEDELSGWPLERNPLIWMNFILYYASIFYNEYLSERCKYVVVAIKVQAVGFLFLFFFHGFSTVLANRLNDYFSIASILLWTASVYAFSPKIISKLISNFISTARFVSSMLFYALSLLYM